MKTKIEIENNLNTLPSQFADLLGVEYASTVSKEHKKVKGQFFTPTKISDFMGSIASKPTSNNITILDPGCGTAILTCSLIEKIVGFGLKSIELVAYESDIKLFPYTEQSLQNLKNWLKEKNVKFKYTLLASDFIEDMSTSLKTHSESFDYIISNPPYFKLSKDDKRVKLFQNLVKGQSNIYSFFMAVSVSLLKKDGELIFIVPRSFASGQYFNSFRDYFFSQINLNFVHLFKSRSKTFDRDSVLQELLILKGDKCNSENVTISTSEGLKDLQESKLKSYHISEIIDLKSKAKILHLPTTKFEKNVMQLFKSWKNNLIDFNIQISTGRVVSFRSRNLLFETYQNTTVFLTPLYWLHNVTKMSINWPNFIPNKSQYINMTEKSEKLLLPNKNYVFLRRFSSKDDKSRLIAAPYFSHYNKNKLIGVENKLNYIYNLKGELQENEAVGIAALLNSNIFDTYFRTFNGNVNVSATEIRLMPFPPIETIREVGNRLIEKSNYSEETINEITSQWLTENIELIND
jgi:adenine-specific DNA-methyltransferase